MFRASLTVVIGVVIGVAIGVGVSALVGWSSTPGSLLSALVSSLLVMLPNWCWCHHSTFPTGAMR